MPLWGLAAVTTRWSLQLHEPGFRSQTSLPTTDGHVLTTVQAHL